MKEAEKKENCPTNNIKEKYNIQLFSENKSSFKVINSIDSERPIYSYVQPSSDEHLTSVFHPPTYC